MPTRLLSGLLRSKARVLSAGLSCCLLMAAHIAWSVPFMLERSSSVGLNLVLILVWMAFALAAGAFFGVLLGDLLFGRGWRAGATSPDDAEATLPDDSDPEVLVRGMRVHGLKLSMLTVACAAVIVHTSNLAFGDFFATYRRSGYLATAFRGDDPRLKVTALRRIGEEGGEALVERVPLAVTRLSDEDAAVRAEAAKALARAARAIRPNLLLLARAGVPVETRWERHVHRLLRQDALPRMSAMLEAPPVEGGGPEAEPGLRASARTAAWLFLASVAPGRLVELAPAAKGPDDELALLLALGRMGRPDAVPIIRPHLASGSDPLMRMAAVWAAGQVLDRYEPPDRPRVVDPRIEKAVELVSALAEDESMLVRCAVLDALRLARDARRDRLLFKAMRQATPADRCPSKQVRVPDGPPIALVAEAGMRFKALEAIAAIAVGNRRVQARLRMLLAEPGVYGEEFLTVVRGVLRSVDEARPE